jgi:hypothetical protein
LDKWAKTPKGDFLNFLLGTKDYDFLYSLVMFLFFLKIDLVQMMFSLFLLVYHAYDVFSPCQFILVGIPPPCPYDFC